MDMHKVVMTVMLMVVMMGMVVGEFSKRHEHTAKMAASVAAAVFCLEAVYVYAQV